METEKKIALKFMPYFMADKKEPFNIEAVGYSVFYEQGKSKSCKRTYSMDKATCKYMIEYAIFYDFDIQHLYDLEHVFVYVGYAEEVIDVEASFHGKFLKAMINGVLRFHETTHPILYMQPGKHAMMPDPSYFHLYIGLRASCMEDAGLDGFLIAPMFQERFRTSDKIDKRVREYIQEKYAFVPSEEYIPMPVGPQQVIPYEELDQRIVEHMEHWLQVILTSFENRS